MMRRYPAYRESGVEWLGEVPEGWEVKRLGNLFDQVDEPGRDELPILSVSIHSGVSDEEIAPDDLERKVTRSDDRSKYKAVRRSDLVYNMMRAWQGGFGTVAIDGMVSPAYVVARPRQSQLFLTSYVENVLRTPHAVEEMRRHSHGVTDFRLRLYWDEFKAIQVPLPPLPEQTAIAAFLDRETAKIDALVAEQRRLIDLLREKRKAVISHAVTKGLNPAAPMKPSGVDWLGDVPEGWEVKKLKHIGQAIIGLTYSPADVVDEDEGVLVLRSSNVQKGVIALDDNVYVKAEIPDGLRTRVGDILICARNGSRALVGKNARIDEASANQTFGAFMTVFRSDLNDYLFHVFNSFLFESQSGLYSSTTINQLTSGTLMVMQVPIPAPTEQAEIARFLTSANAKFDALTATAETAITLLRERRAALISAAVTGKIDVRHLAQTQTEAA